MKRSPKKTFVCVFAHPDDESFGPSGTICKLSKKYDIHLLCVTKGEAGGNHKKLAELRTKELDKSAKILGIKKIHFLGFVDGMLSNSLYHKLAEEIEVKLRKIKPEGLMTFEPKGISGHIDHITVSMATSYVFNKLPFIKKIFYAVELENQMDLMRKDYFIYVPEGYRKSEVDKIVDVSEVWGTKLKAIRAHKSQNNDIEKIIKLRETFPKEEYFLVVKKQKS